ncbi:MAG: hypothetical protein AAB916_02330 [Patescibacteria group bacterium]
MPVIFERNRCYSLRELGVQADFLSWVGSHATESVIQVNASSEDEALF